MSRLSFSQIECDARWRPRSGCTQWFTGVTGTLQSYNFAGGKHLAHQDYSICIRQEAGYCSIQYTADTFKVSLGLSGTPAAAPTTVSTASKVGLTTCSTVDYLFIPLGQSDVTCSDLTREHYCYKSLS